MNCFSRPWELSVIVWYVAQVSRYQRSNSFPNLSPYPLHPHFQAFHTHTLTPLAHICWFLIQSHHWRGYRREICLLKILPHRRAAMTSAGGLTGLWLVAFLTLHGANFGGNFRFFEYLHLMASCHAACLDIKLPADYLSLHEGIYLVRCQENVNVSRSCSRLE